ncbi:MAG: hypothetical protein LBK13_04405 [Spirochaetales bacterium]|jgi:hypothetical protein|nr:hypothetical protein [Spirochaetales bacterium]
MKKIFLILGVLVCAVAGIYAQQPDNLAFEIGLGNVWDVGGGGNATAVNYGFYSVFSDVLAAGVSLTDINDNGSRSTLGLVSILATLVDNVSIRLSMGIAEPPAGAGIADSPCVGLGLNYDVLLARESNLLVFMGVFADWIGVFDTGPNALSRFEDGGAFSIGLRTKIGF